MALDGFNTSTSKKTDIPPLVNLQVSNPITYLKLWWKKIIGNEGIEIKLKVRPLTAIVIIVLLFGLSFGAGWVSALFSQIPILKDVIPNQTPVVYSTPASDQWRLTAFSGLLQQTGGKFYLVTTDAEAITLEVPSNVNLAKYIGKKIFATGKYYKGLGLLEVSEASDLEVVLQSISLPTVAPSKTVEPTVTPTQIPDQTEIPNSY